MLLQTGPVAPKKMVINALNSGAATYMADFEGEKDFPNHSERILFLAECVIDNAAGRPGSMSIEHKK